MQIAFLRSPNVDETIRKTGFLDEASLLRRHFEKHGAELIQVDWRDENTQWSNFDFVIPKCAWDYFDHYHDFLLFLDRVEKDKVRFKNALSLIKWNSNKHYLVEMLEKGASVAPLRLITQAIELESIHHDLDKHGKILLKPAVSGGAKQTLVYGRDDFAKCKADARAILHDCAVIVQPFLKDVEEGEWSFFFFGGAFSHAIKKVPKSGDFRAHSLFGAQNIAVTPTAAQIEEARRILSFLPAKEHYARVDGLYVRGTFQLIELELIEPYLYFEGAGEEAPERFAKALMA